MTTFLWGMLSGTMAAEAVAINKKGYQYSPLAWRVEGETNDGRIGDFDAAIRLMECL